MDRANVIAALNVLQKRWTLEQQRVVRVSDDVHSAEYAGHGRKVVGMNNLRILRLGRRGRNPVLPECDCTGYTDRAYKKLTARQYDRTPGS